MELTPFGTEFSLESIKVMAESIGMGNLADDAAKDLAGEVSYRLKKIIQESAKFMRHGRRSTLSVQDVDKILEVKDVNSPYGFQAKDCLTPFRFVSNGDKELYIVEDKNLDLSEYLKSNRVPNQPKLPLEPSLRTHWLCVNGVQPVIPENPPPVTKDKQKLESIDPISTKNNPKSTEKWGTRSRKVIGTEIAPVKKSSVRELSIEQQFYFKQIMEACIGLHDGRRNAAVRSLWLDPGIHAMLPRLSIFITEGVRVSVARKNLAGLVYMMRMVRALICNENLSIEKYLHELIPLVVTCMVTKELGSRPEKDDHWVLRDYSSRSMALICIKYNTTTNNIQTRATRVFSQALVQNNIPLASLYGAIRGLCDLGSNVIKVLVIPKVKLISERIEPYFDVQNDSIIDRKAAKNIKILIMESVAPVLVNLQQPPDVPEDYEKKFGYIGTELSIAVGKARKELISKRILKSSKN